MVKFLIICTGYNCGNLAGKCVQSVISQRYQNFTAVFLSDGSMDNTAEVITEAVKGKKHLHAIAMPDNKGAACRRWDIVQLFAPDDETVILLLGMDDELLPRALARIAEEYKCGKWMTYGNWINPRGKMLPEGFLEFDEETHKNRDYRQVKYRSTAPNTFGKDRIGVIKDPIYMYNDNLPGGTLNRLGRDYKHQLLDIIKARPKRALLKRKPKATI